MLSVLIPAYNTDYRLLVVQLSAQAAKLTIPIEVILLDDASSIEYIKLHEEVASLGAVRVVRVTENLGRSGARQKLCDLASYNNLLYIDADSMLESEQFLENYIGHLPLDNEVIVGGRSYARTVPDDKAYRLHWKYGSEREARDPVREHRRGFMSNNFLIEKRVFNEIGTIDQLHGYGHEDTWMGIRLQQLGIPVRQINNPARHIGLERLGDFLRKTDEALLNLLRLSTTPLSGMLKQHVKILRCYFALRVTSFFLIPFFRLIDPLLKRNLHSASPSLFLFDLYRLHRLFQLERGKKYVRA